MNANVSTVRRAPVSLFDELFFGAHSTSTYAAPVDVREYRDRFVLKADVPGFAEEDLKVQVADGELVVEGSRKEEERNAPEADEESTWLLRERSGASFRRSFKLGDGLDAEKIQASYRAGTLTLVIPKAERAKPRLIPIGSTKH